MNVLGGDICLGGVWGLCGGWRGEYEWMMDYCTIYSQTIEHRPSDIDLYIAILYCNT